MIASLLRGDITIFDVPAVVIAWFWASFFDDWVEIKTISPEKGKGKVLVKRAGNFNKLLVVKIDESFRFESRMIDRKKLGKGKGKNASYSWGSESE